MRRGVVVGLSVSVLAFAGVWLLVGGHSHPATVRGHTQTANAALIRAANQVAKVLAQGMVSGQRAALPPKVVAPRSLPQEIVPQACFVASALAKCSETPCIQYAAPTAQPAVQVPLTVPGPWWAPGTDWPCPEHGRKPGA